MLKFCDITYKICLRNLYYEMRFGSLFERHISIHNNSSQCLSLASINSIDVVNQLPVKQPLKKPRFALARSRRVRRVRHWRRRSSRMFRNLTDL